MTTRGTKLRHVAHRGALGGLAAVLSAAGGLTGCASGRSAGGPGASPPAPNIATPLATSLPISGGTWATVPMGRLDEPLNTFWQLFYRPRNGSSWSNKVEATATATNGGLVLAPAGPSVLVGVRPSANLTFTPLISSSDAGGSWSNGLIGEGLAARPDALAMAGGEPLALVGGGPGSQVLAGRGGISAWRALVTERHLAAGAAGRTCGLGALTAVGALGARPLVGGSCANAGVVGLFAQADGGWRLAGPALARPFDKDQAEVLGLQSSGPREAVLLAVVGGGRTSLVAAAPGPKRGWSTSAPLALGDNEQVASFGPSSTGGYFALLQAPSGADRLLVTVAGGARWDQLPAPPAGTATVAIGPGATTEALVADGTRFSVWSLRPGSSVWAQGQVMKVPVQYGSSS